MKVRVEWSARNTVSLDEALADERLSFRAKGLFAFLHSSGPEAAFDLKQLAAASSEGKDALRTALAELEAAGYCERVETVEERKDEAASGNEESAAPVPVIESLFGEAFAPPIPIDRLPGVEPDEAETLVPEDAAVERIIQRLNALRRTHWEWAHYVPLMARFPKNVEKIRQRLRDGHTEQDLILVLEYRAAVDGGDERSRRYFNSDTPFNTRNFEENLAMALDWDARGRVVPVGKMPGTNRGAQYYLQQDGRNK